MFYIIQILDQVNQLTIRQRSNESQKAVIIDMMKSVGEIASKFNPFWGNFDLDL